MTDCFVYLIGHKTDGGVKGPVKCGVSRTPWPRIKALQTGSPEPLEMLGIFALPDRNAALAVERAFHEAMAESRMAGEWFRTNPLEAVEALCRCLVEFCASRWEGDAVYEAVLRSGAYEAHQRCLLERAKRDGREPRH